jgi:tetratricopeptide (TPR) repeat protein
MRNRMWRVIVVTTMFVAVAVHGQESSSRDLDLYYRFPVSISARYDMISPFAPYGSQFNVYSLGGAVMVPLPSHPVIQPRLEGGLTTFDSQDPADPEEWDHASVYGVLGTSYVRRLSKNFELGGGVGVGVAMTTFPSLVEEPVGYATFLAVLGANLGLSPSYNVHLSVEPRLLYQYGFTDLDMFNGLSFSIGISAAYRFGDDPDAPQNAIRSVEFTSVDLPALFAGMQSYYVSNPMGSVTIVNTERTPIENVSVAFFQQGLMDSPTVSVTLPELEPGVETEVPLNAVFNSSVFELEGITPLSGEVVVQYVYRGRPAEQTYPVSYDLYDKTALTWDENQKVAAFITRSDSALRNYQATLLRYTRPAALDGISDAVESAIAAYTGLEELGIVYQADPTSPFLTAQANTLIVDSVSLPRDTLTRFAGDCDDLTVLFCTMLESAGVETGFVTVPGHIFPVVNTGVSANRYASLHPDRDVSINIDGELWIPVEVTMLGSGDFGSAWRRGMELYSQFEAPDRELHRTASAQEVYRPVGLRQTDLGLQYGNEAAILDSFQEEINDMKSMILQDFENRAATRGSSAQYNRLGIAAARLGEYPQAESAFRSALRQDASYVQARINLGALQLLQGRYTSAILTLQDAAERLERQEQPDSDSLSAIYINLARAHYSLEQFDHAERYVGMASTVDPERAAEYSYIAAIGAEGAARAAEVSDGGVLFAGDE